MTREMTRFGPFVNEEGDVWVPSTVGGISKAWPIAREAAWETLHFEGMDDNVSMTLHEYGCDHPDDEPCDEEQPCSWVGRAYHFRDGD